MVSTYIKTPKGQGEIETRSGGLALRARRVLIMIDGRRSVDEVRALMLNDPAFDEALALLEREGYVAPLAASPSRSVAPARHEPAASADGGESSRLETARNFMMNTLNAFHGPYNKLGLMKKVHQCSAAAELVELFDDWVQAIGETRMGRMRSEELQFRLREVLDGAC